MARARNGRTASWGLLLAGLSFAPVPAAQEPPAPRPEAASPSLAERADRRVRATSKQFDLIWQYYRQNRVDTFDVYLWSRLLLDARRDVTRRPADRAAACQEHLDHMRDLEVLIRKIRRLGFGRSSDVGASEAWRIEAEYWLAEAKSG